MTGTTDISVIIPLSDHRGVGASAIESWTRRQTLARERFEVIVVDAGEEPDLTAKISGLLTSRDTLLPAPEHNTCAAYNRGASAASAPVLFITEAHCVADSRCLEEVLLALADGDWDGVWCESGGLPGNAFADMEQRLVAEGSAARGDGPANVLSIRGSAIRARLFHEAGGLRTDLDHFAEIVLADELDRLGSRMVRASGAIVRHANVEKAGRLLSELVRYGEAEGKYAVEPTTTDARARACRAWQRRSAVDREAARARVWAGLRHLGRAIRTSPRGAPVLALHILRLIPTALFGALPAKAAMRGRLAILRAKLALLPSRSESRFRAYRAAWNAAIEYGGLTYLAKNGVPSSRVSGTYDLRSDRALVGFHAPERPPTVFRWTEPTAVIRTKLEPGQFTVQLSFVEPPRGGIHGVAAFFDGHRLTSSQTDAPNPTEPRLNLELTPRHFASGSTHMVTLACPGFRAPGDSRVLGLAVGSLAINPR